MVLDPRPRCLDEEKKGGLAEHARAMLENFSSMARKSAADRGLMRGLLRPKCLPAASSSSNIFKEPINA